MNLFSRGFIYRPVILNDDQDKENGDDTSSIFHISILKNRLEDK